MLKDFTTSVNNANKINPPLYLTPQIFDINGKTVIYIWVPEGTQLRRLNGRIWDRTHEGDIDITDNAELVYKMYARKQSTYFVNKVRTKFNLRGIWILNRVIGSIVMLVSVAGLIYTLLGESLY